MGRPPSPRVAARCPAVCLDLSMPTGREWIDRFAREIGAEPPDDGCVEALLELASVAAHGSERLAAPIACYLVGRQGIEAGAALEAARRLADV